MERWKRALDLIERERERDVTAGLGLAPSDRYHWREGKITGWFCIGITFYMKCVQVTMPKYEYYYLLWSCYYQ